MNAGAGGDREDRALEALIASAFSRDDRAEEDVDPGRLPQLSEEKEGALESLGTDFVRRLVGGHTAQREAGTPPGPESSEKPRLTGKTPGFPVGESNNHLLERARNMMLTHKRLSAATAALTALAASLILYVSLCSSSGPAYALEQTVQANKQVMSYHVKIVPPAGALGEAWVELDGKGDLLRVRMDFPEPPTGPKVSILSDGRAEVWFKDRNLRGIFDNKKMIENVVEQCKKMRPLFDPKLAFEQLQANVKAGRAHLEAKQPSRDGQPIVLTVTSKAAPDRRGIYEVDFETKRVSRVTEYRRSGDQWKQVSQREYLDYNKEIDPKVFQLEVPKDTITIDQIKNKERSTGLVKGDLTDGEIAAKVAREFFEALIAGNYQKVDELLPAMPAGALKKTFERDQVKFLRIVEVGKPTPDPKTNAIRVPVKVQMEVKGERSVESISPLIQSKSGQWRIIGGI